MAARAYLTKVGRGVAGLTQADAKRRVQAYYKRGLPGQPLSKNSVRTTFVVDRHSDSVDAGRWVSRGRRPAKLQRAPTPRSPTGARLSPATGSFLIRRKSTRKNQPGFRVLHRERGLKPQAVKLVAEFTRTLIIGRRRAVRIYQATLLKELQIIQQWRRPA